MLEILLFLFQNYLENSIKGAENPDASTLTSQLKGAGFDLNEIQQAFNWFEKINRLEVSPDINVSQAIRCFNYEEQSRLSAKARGFLQFLEHSKVLDPYHRELVIDRALALGQKEISLEQMQWIVLMVLFNKPEQKAALAWVENYLSEPQSSTLH